MYKPILQTIFIAVYLLPQLLCEKQVVRRIVNGKDSSIEFHPWIVYITFDAKAAKTTCGGTIVSASKVLTSQNCLNQTKSGGTIRMGNADKSNKELTVKFEKKHVKLFPRTEVDLALIDFKQLAPFKYTSEQLKPIPISNATLMPESKVVVSGWGKACADPPGCHVQDKDLNTLQEVELTIQGNHACKANLFEFCAGGENSEGNPQDACTGDSGSPAECITKDGKRELCGVVSSGPNPPNCGRKAGKYTRLSDGEVVAFIKGEKWDARAGGKSDSSLLRCSIGLTVLGFVGLYKN